MSTTINSYSIALGLNASGLIDGSKLARNEARQLERTFQQLSTPVEKVNRQLELLEKAVDNGAIRESVYRESVRRLTDSVRDNSASLHDNAEALRRDNALIAEGERLTKSLMSVEEKHAQEMRRLKQLRSAQAIGETTYARAVEAANRKLSDSQIVTATIVKTPPRVKDAIGHGKVPGTISSGASALTNRLTNLAAGYIGVYTAANLVGDSIRKSASIEKAAASYEVLTGSAEKAHDILSGVRDLASRGVSIDGLNQAARTMLGFNVAAQDIVPTLWQMAQITGGDRERLDRLSLAFAQTASAGRLMGEELNQMIDAGFNPLQEISRTTGVSMAQLKNDMRDGLITFDMVQGAFASATSEGGRFFGMLEASGNTTGGAMTRAAAAVELLEVELGDALAPVVRAISNDIIDMASNTDKAADRFKNLGDAAMGFYNFSKSELSGLPSFLRGFGFIGDQLGTMADQFTTADLFNKARTMGNGFAGYLEANYATRQAEIDALLRLQDSGSLLMKEANGMPNAISMQVEDFRRRMIEKGVFKDPNAPAGAANAQTAQGKSLGITQDVAEKSDPLKLTHSPTVSLDTAMENAKKAAAATATKLWETVDAENARNKHIEEGERLQREAERIREQTIDPAERLARSVADIARMQELGLLTQFEAERAKNRLYNESSKDVNVESPKALVVGSQEAYKFFVDQANRKDNEQVRIAQRQLDEAQEQRRLLQRANDHLRDLKDVAPKRIR